MNSRDQLKVLSKQQRLLLSERRKGESSLTAVISQAMDESLNRILPLIANEKYLDPLSEYIPKSAVRGKILSSSTLWKHEQKGNLKTYAIGGKRFYRRSEIQNLIQEVKK